MPNKKTLRDKLEDVARKTATIDTGWNCNSWPIIDNWDEVISAILEIIDKEVTGVSSKIPVVPGKVLNKERKI